MIKTLTYVETEPISFSSIKKSLAIELTSDAIYKHDIGTNIFQSPISDFASRAAALASGL